MQAIKMAVGLNALRAHGRANLVLARTRGRGALLIGPRPAQVCQGYAAAAQAVRDAQKLVAYDISSAQPSSVTLADKSALQRAEGNLRAWARELAKAGYGVNSLGQCVPLLSSAFRGARGPNIGIAVPGLRPKRPRFRVGAETQFNSQADKDAAVAADTALIAQLTASVTALTTTADSLQTLAQTMQDQVNSIPQDPPGTATDDSQQSLLDGFEANLTTANNNSTDANVQLDAAQTALSDAQDQLSVDQSAPVVQPGQPPANPPPLPVNPPVVPIVPPPAAPSSSMSTGEKIAIALVAAAVVVGGVSLAGKKGKRK